MTEPKTGTGICQYCGMIQTDPKYSAFNPHIDNAMNNFITCDDCLSKKMHIHIEHG